MRCFKQIYVKDKILPCGRCVGCLSNKRQEWGFRIMNEADKSISAFFITLTYEEQKVPVVNVYGKEFKTLYKKDLQNFNKRLRHEIMSTEDPEGLYMKYDYSPLHKKMAYSPRMRFFACGEYGQSSELGRPHYHGIYFNLPDWYVDYNPINKKQYSDILEDVWNKGFVTVSEVTEGRALYVAKYTLTSLFEDFNGDVREKPFAIMSRKPGIGAGYINDDIKNYFANNPNNYAVSEGGIKRRLSRYYKGEIFSEETARIASERSNKYYVEQEKKRRDKIISIGGNFAQIERDEQKTALRKVRKSIKKGML